jgi:DNA-binding ferritin-like protein
MTEDATPRWDEVGERFTQLGHTLQQRWADEREATSAAGADAADEVRGAVDGVTASLDELAKTITRTVNDTDVHDAARSAAGGLVEALSSSLGDLASRIQPKQD